MSAYVDIICRPRDRALCWGSHKSQKWKISGTEAVRIRETENRAFSFVVRTYFPKNPQCTFCSELLSSLTVVCKFHHKNSRSEPGSVWACDWRPGSDKDENRRSQHVYMVCLMDYSSELYGLPTRSPAGYDRLNGTGHRSLMKANLFSPSQPALTRFLGVTLFSEKPDGPLGNSSFFLRSS